MTPSTQPPGEPSGNPGELKSPGEGDLIARLRRTTPQFDMGHRSDHLINPDGPDAADTIERLTERVARMEEFRAMIARMTTSDENEATGNVEHILALDMLIIQARTFSSDPPSHGREM